MITPQQEALWAADIARRCLEASPDNVDAALDAAEYIVAQGPTPEDLTALSTDAGGRKHRGKGPGGGQFVGKSEDKDNRNTLSENEVLDKIKASPQFKDKDVDWDRYAERYKIQGEFARHEVDSSVLKDLINNQWLSLVQAKNIDEKTVGVKTDSGEFNDVIITARPGGQMLVVDGNHSLVAAIRSGKKVNIIFPRGLASNFGIELAEDDTSLSIGAYLSHDIANPKAQGLLTAALKKADAFARDALKSLESALDREGADSGQAILAFVNEYHAKLADLLTEAQLSAALEGALEVADKVPQLDADAEAIARIYGHIPRPAFSTDAQGHEHKGKGKGGGQFVSKGKGGDNDDKSKKKGSPEKALENLKAALEKPKKKEPEYIKAFVPRKGNKPNPILSDGARPILTDQEIDAINDYTISAHDELNEILRNREKLSKRDSNGVLHALLQAAFAKAVPLTSPVQLLRGLDLFGTELPRFRKKLEDAARKKQIVQVPGYLSTTTLKKIPEDFDGAVEIHILGKKGLDVKPYSDAPGESEFLINHNTKFKVLDVQQRPGKLHIYKEQIE